MNEKELAEVRKMLARVIIQADIYRRPLPTENWGNLADQILNTPITIERDCPYCEGTGLIGGAAINDRCDDCKGTGKLDKTFTIKQCIEEKMR